MEIGAAELAVGDPLEAHVLLGAHDLADAFVLDRVQVLRRKAAGGEFLPRLLQALGSQKTADMVGAKRRTGHGAPPWKRCSIQERRSSHAARGLGNPDGSSAPRGEEGSQHRRRLALADAAVDFRRVMAGRLAEEAAGHGRPRRPWGRARRNRGGGCGRARSRRRTSRRARGSRRDRSRRAARSRSRRRPRGWRSVSACAVGSARSRVRLPARAMTAPSRTSAAPIGASPRASAARASAKARVIGSFASSSAFDTRYPRSTDAGRVFRLARPGLRA